MVDPYSLAFGVMIAIGFVLLLLAAVGDGLSDIFASDADLSIDDGPGWFSFATFGVFVMSWGLLGYVASYYTEIPGWAQLLAGAILGVVAVILVRQLVLKPLFNQQSNSHMSVMSYVGLTATVTTGIETGRAGEIALTDGNGARVVMRAVSEGIHIPVNTVVSIKSVAESLAVVETVS